MFRLHRGALARARASTLAAALATTLALAACGGGSPSPQSPPDGSGGPSTPSGPTAPAPAPAPERFAALGTSADSVSLDWVTLAGSARVRLQRQRSDGAVRTLGVLDGGVFDIEIDGDEIIGVANNQLAFERTGERAPGASLFRIDRTTGATLSENPIGENTVLIGDLEIGADGRAYLSNSLTPHIYAIDKDGALQTLGDDPRFINLQGIALDQKKQRLFIADYLAGLFVIDLKTGDVAAIDNPSDAHLGGIDGLYLYKGDLIGEAALLAFDLAQHPSPGLALIVLAGYVRFGGLVSDYEPNARRIIRQGFMRGLRARKLLHVDYTDALSRNVNELRAELRLGPPPQYRAVRPHEVDLA